VTKADTAKQAEILQRGALTWHFLSDIQPLVK
jgi:hypothetical protein